MTIAAQVVPPSAPPVPALAAEAIRAAVAHPATAHIVAVAATLVGIVGVVVAVVVVVAKVGNKRGLGPIPHRGHLVLLTVNEVAVGVTVEARPGTVGDGGGEAAADRIREVSAIRDLPVGHRRGKRGTDHAHMIPNLLHDLRNTKRKNQMHRMQRRKAYHDLYQGRRLPLEVAIVGVVVGVVVVHPDRVPTLIRVADLLPFQRKVPKAIVGIRVADLLPSRRKVPKAIVGIRLLVAAEAKV
jgi:hypothetical protein